MRIDPPLLLLASLLLAACAGSGTQETTPSKPAAPTSPSPLGAGYPDPARMIAVILREMERHDFTALCSYLAGPGRSGKPVPLIPGRNVPEIPANRGDLWPPLNDLQGLASFLAEPWKTVHFGPPENLRNDPPFIKVPVRVTYAWEAIPKKNRLLLIHAVAAREKRNVTYAEVVRLGKARERAEAAGSAPLPSLAFAWIKGRWRLFLGPLKW